jgi:hypothetical protein
VVQLDGSNKLFSNAPATDRNVLADIHINRNYDKASGEGWRSHFPFTTGDREEGIKKGKVELVVRLLERRVGEIAPDIQSRIRRLSIEQLENLGEAVLDFTSASDLTDWLQD